MNEIKVHELTDIWSKTKGLMFAENIYPIYFKTRWGIHTFFMKKPISVIILNNQDKIVHFKRKLVPNRFFMWNPKFYKVFELPCGMLEGLNISRGDRFRYTLARD